MKKILIFALTAGLMFGFSSCKKSTSEASDSAAFSLSEEDFAGAAEVAKTYAAETQAAGNTAIDFLNAKKEGNYKEMAALSVYPDGTETSEDMFAKIYADVQEPQKIKTFKLEDVQVASEMQSATIQYGVELNSGSEELGAPMQLVKSGDAWKVVVDKPQE